MSKTGIVVSRRSGSLVFAGMLAGLLIVWTASASSPPQRAGGLIWQERVQVAEGNAYQGPWRMNESDFDYVDDPTVAIGPDSAGYVAWVDQSRQDVFLQIFGPDGEARLEEPVNVSRSPGIFSWLPRIIVAPGAGEADDAPAVYAAWQEIVFSGGSHGGEIFFARSTDGGTTFEEPQNLSNSPAGAGKGRLTRDSWHNGSLALARGPEGNLHVAWTEYEGALRVSTSSDGGAKFTRPLHVAGSDAAPARGPSLAAGRGGVVHLAWTVGEDPAADIRLATSRDAGRTFGEPRVLFPGDGHADAPKLAISAGGALHLAYAESAEGPFRSYRIRYARSADGGGTFDEPRVLQGLEADGFRSMNFPSLDVDARGNPYLVWELYPSLRSRSMGLGFARSTDGGRTFGAPAVMPGSLDPELGTNGGRQGLLTSKLAVGDAGEALVVNSTYLAGEASRIWLFRGTPGAGG